MRSKLWLVVLLVCLLFVSCSDKSLEKRTVLAIPVYGQSLALGEEAVRVTNFDTLTRISNGLIVTENLDDEFGFFSDTHFKQWMKKMLGDRHRAFELSIYGMSEVVSAHLKAKGKGDSIMISIFPGGQGATCIRDMGKGSRPYQKFLDEIEAGYNKAQSRGWRFEVPAFCWMQGENDIVWDRTNNYQKDLKDFQVALNKDIKAITKQVRDVVCITYQTNCLTLSPKFNSSLYQSRETSIPQGQLELIRSDALFSASGPTYPYSFVGENVHLDGLSQKRLGYLAGLSVIRLLDSKPSHGLLPVKFEVHKNEVFVSFNIPYPPLVLDTIEVSKAGNYGFSVVDSDDVNILEKVLLEDNTIRLICNRSPVGSKARYAINGVHGKTGKANGPRGNLRDSQGSVLSALILKNNYPLHNWCYQFDELLK